MFKGKTFNQPSYGFIVQRQRGLTRLHVLSIALLSGVIIGLVMGGL